jgi:metal-responsive CopG/Arc/MetJ family transcriptional regulator
MRTVVDLPDDELQAIKALAKREKISQAEAIRRAVRAYLHARPAPDKESPAFGLWEGREDALQYQDKLRDEWSR